MNHKITNKPDSAPKRIPFKFHTRNLKLSKHPETTLKQVRVKRVFIKSFLHGSGRGQEHTKYLNSNSEDLFRLLKKSSKILKTLRNLQINSVSSSYIQRRLKHSKCLKNFYIDSDRWMTKMKEITFFIKRLPAHIRNIRIDFNPSSEELSNIFFYKIARSLRNFPKLENFHRWFAFGVRRNRFHVSKELKIYDKSLSRLSNIKKAMYCIGENEQCGFQKRLRGGQVFPHISGLRIALTCAELADYERLYNNIQREGYGSSGEFYPTELNNQQYEIYEAIKNDILAEDFLHDGVEDVVKTPPRSPPRRIGDYNTSSDSFDSDDYDHPEYKHRMKWRERERDQRDRYRVQWEENEGQEEQENQFNTRTLAGKSEGRFSEFEANCIMKEDIQPFYRFELFPNLRRLEMIQPDLMYPLGSFVEDGFKALKNLKELKIDIRVRSKGMEHMFKGLEHLPLLEKFSLEISSLNGEDWNLLEKFLENQSQLRSLEIVLFRKSESSSGAWHLNNIIKDLKNKPLLKSLKLKYPFCTLEALSKSFANFDSKIQLRSLTLEASDESVVTSEKRPAKRVEGLCNFFQSQKNSLRKLALYVPCAYDENTVAHLCEGVATLTQLRKFDFQLNCNKEQYANSLKSHFENIAQGGNNSNSYSYYQRDEKEKQKIQFPEPKSWNLGITRFLRQLQNLEEFEFKFRIPQVGYRDKVNSNLSWFLDILRALQSLKRLRVVVMKGCSPKEFKKLEQKMAALVLEFRNIRAPMRIQFEESLYTSSGPVFPKLRDAIDKVHQIQSRKCDIMF